MKAETLKNIVSTNNHIFYGLKEVKIIKIFEIFDFVDVIFMEDKSDEIVTLPISVLSFHKSKEKYININRLFDISNLLEDI